MGRFLWSLYVNKVLLVCGWVGGGWVLSSFYCCTSLLCSCVYMKIPSSAVNSNSLYCSSKPTGGMVGPSLGQENFTRPTYGHRTAAAPCDWICTICGCMNFARRTSCFQVLVRMLCYISHFHRPLPHPHTPPEHQILYNSSSHLPLSWVLTIVACSLTGEWVSGGQGDVLDFVYLLVCST